MKNQRVIVFDSPDGTGKTEIARALALSMNIPYFRMDTQHDNWRKGQFKTALEFDQTYLASFLLQTGHSVVIDRAWPSEYVYSRVFKRETNERVLRNVDQMHSRIGTIVVVPLRRDYARARGDDLVPPERLLDLHREYDGFCESWTSCDTVRIYVDEFKDQTNRQIGPLSRAIEQCGGFGRKTLVLDKEEMVPCGTFSCTKPKPRDFTFCEDCGQEYNEDPESFK